MEAQVALVGADLLPEAVRLATKEVTAPLKELLVAMDLPLGITMGAVAVEAHLKQAQTELYLLEEKAGTEPHRQ